MIESSQIFIRPIWINEPSIHNFFKRVLSQFLLELNLLAKQWYDYPKGLDGKPGYNDVFALIERSYVGLFNNAVIRCFEKDSVLQEFSVHINQGTYKRGDYLVKHWGNGTSVNFLFEAKCKQFNGKKYSGDESNRFLQPFIDQGLTYYKAEKDYYKGSTYISSLLFEWVRYEEHVKKVLGWDSLDDGVTDFYCFYHSKVAGLMVYGNLKKVQ